jgi:hypothetical protein
MRTMVRIDGKWHKVTINKQEATGLLALSDVRTLIETNSSDVHEFSPSPWLFIHAAERINEILHKGGINKNDPSVVTPKPANGGHSKTGQ